MSTMVDIYSGVKTSLNTLGYPVYTPTQFKSNDLPVIIVDMVSGAPTKAFRNARQYRYPFNISVITDKNGLTQGLNIADKVMDCLRGLSIPNYRVQLESDPNIDSLVDTSAGNQLNRQLIIANILVIDLII